MNASQNSSGDFSRRDFIRGGSLASVLTLLGGVEIKAADGPKGAEGKSLDGPKVKCGIIGLGSWGRTLLEKLNLQAEAQVAMICDKYGPMLRRSAANAPGAAPTENAQAVLDNKDIQAVFIATPTHQHKDLVLAALQAGKHVYCEAPLAATIEDARSIARAAQAAPAQVFQTGMTFRSDPHRYFILQFYRSGAAGRTVMARTQWHKKTSWRFASPNPEREKEINWRLDQGLSTGLAGEVGVHEIDLMTWFLKDRPLAVTGFGGVLHWTDGRQVPDTVQAVLEYPGQVQGIFHATLANSYDAEYEVFYGSDAAVMIRGNKGWMFKEVDAPLLGWEVYARKDAFGAETGIVLQADASKSLPPKEGATDAGPTTLPVEKSLENFLANVNEVSGAVEDFIATYGNDKKGLAKHVATVRRAHAAGWREGFEATVIALKTNEAILGSKRIVFEKEWFALS